MPDQWLPTLIAPTPEAGYEIAIKLSRMAVKMTQPDGAVREKLRSIYDRDAKALVSVAGVVATNFQTVAAANNWWRAHTRGDEV